MRVTLLGTGDTTGTPTVGCDCDTCRAARDRSVERSRFSVHVQNEQTGESLLVDVSPDFRHQFLTQDVPLPDEAVVTHVHFDHLDGLGNAYRLVDDLTVHAANEVDPVTDESVAGTVRRKYDYLDAVSVSEQDPLTSFSACGFDLTLVPVDHPPLVCYGLVVEDPATDGKLSISGDTSYGIPEASREALADPDLLLADGIVPASLCEHHPKGGKHYTAWNAAERSSEEQGDSADHGEHGTPRTFGTKHMTREGAHSLADDLAADRTRLVHVSHFYPAEEAFADDLAVDGETFEI